MCFQDKTAADQKIMDEEPFEALPPDVPPASTLTFVKSSVAPLDRPCGWRPRRWVMVNPQMDFVPHVLKWLCGLELI